MKTITTLAIVLIVSSCATHKRCLRKFQVLPDTVSVVYYRDTIIYQDTIIRVFIPGATVIDSVVIPFPVPEPFYVPDTARAETSLAIAKAWWSYPLIRLSLVQKDTTIEAKLDSAMKEMYHWKSEYYRVYLQSPPEKTPIPAIYKLALWTWGFVYLVVIFGLVRFIYRK